MRTMTLGSVLAVLSLPVVLLAQAQTPPPTGQSADIRDVLDKNQAAIRQYRWVETMIISHKNKVLGQERNQCLYNADGIVQRTRLEGPAAGENAADDVKPDIEKMVAFLRQYVPPDPAKAFAAPGALSVSEQNNLTTYTVRDYAKPGDRLLLSLNPTTKALVRYVVQSYIEKPSADALTLTVTFGQLRDGTSFPSRVRLDVVPKALHVNIANAEYEKRK